MAWESWATMRTWVVCVLHCYHGTTPLQLPIPQLFLRGRVSKCSSARCHSSSRPLFASSSLSPADAGSSLSDRQSADDACHRPPPGFSIIEEFYACVNRRDFDSVRDLIAEDCIYDDLVFPQPFVGRKAIVEFFSKFTGAVGSDLQFVIDDISRDDPFCVGVTWHLEWNGKRFPFSKGCSFYRLTTSHGKQQIIYARDSVEPVVKPGDSTLVVIRAVAGLLKRFPQLADQF